MAIPHMPAYASGGVVYTRPLRAGSRRETAVTGGPESCNLGSGPVNSMVNIMNRPQVAALGPHVLCNLGGGYSPTATVARVSFFEGSPSGHKPNSSDASVSSGTLLLERGSRIGNCATVLYQTSRSMWTVSVPGTAAVSKRQDTVNESASDGVRKHVKFR